MRPPILGVGWPRTGTTTLRRALEILGFGPCHHMMVINQEPERIGLWEALERGEPGAAARALEGFAAGVDNPVAAFWRPLTAAWPSAPVILTVRDPLTWHASYVQTIHGYTFGPDDRPEPGSQRARIIGLLRRIWLENTLQADVTDAGACAAAFERHRRQVVDQLGYRVLVFEVRDGWGPLCRFLEVPVPELPFPHRNSRTFVKEHGHHEV